MIKSRLSQHKQNKLIELFVSGVTARTASELVNVNKNTAAYCFHRLRLLIYQTSLHFQKGAMPDEMPEFTFSGEMGLATLLKEAGLVPSTSEAIRSAQQGGVKINGEKVDNVKDNAPKGTNVYQVGKRKFARITVE